MYYRLDEDKTLKWLQKKVLIAFTRGVDKLHLRMQTVRSMVNIDFVQVVNTAEILKNNALAGKRKGLSSSFTAPDAVVTKKQSSAAAKDRARGDGILLESVIFIFDGICLCAQWLWRNLSVSSPSMLLQNGFQNCEKYSSEWALDRAQTPSEQSGITRLFSLSKRWFCQLSPCTSRLQKLRHLTRPHRTTSAGASATSQPVSDAPVSTSSPVKRRRWDNDVEDSNLKFTHAVGQCKDVGAQVKAKRKKTASTTKVKPKGMKSLFSYFSKKSKWAKLREWHLDYKFMLYVASSSCVWRQKGVSREVVGAILMCKIPKKDKQKWK